MPNYIAIFLRIYLWSVRRYSNADRCIKDIFSAINHYPGLRYELNRKFKDQFLDLSDELNKNFKENLILLQGNIPVSYRLVSLIWIHDFPSKPFSLPTFCQSLK